MLYLHLLYDWLVQAGATRSNGRNGQRPVRSRAYSFAVERWAPRHRPRAETGTRCLAPLLLSAQSRGVYPIPTAQFAANHRQRQQTEVPFNPELCQ